MKKQLLRKNEGRKLSEDSDNKVTGGVENPFDIMCDQGKNKIPGHNEDIWNANKDPNSLMNPKPNAQ